VNPYGRRTLLDLEELKVVRARREAADCVSRSDTDGAAALGTFWLRPDPVAMLRALPRVAPSPRCAEAAQRIEALGFKYGPLTLLANAPFVGLFGKTGYFVAQVLMFLALCGVVALAARSVGAWPWAAAAVFLMLAPGNWMGAMRFSCSDILPILLAVSGAVLFFHGRHTSAAVVIGASIASKALPGLLYLPLVFRMDRRSQIACALIAAASFAPFVLLDAKGVYNNIALYNLVRDADGTGAAGIVPPVLAAAWRLVALSGLVAATFASRFFESSGTWLAFLLAVHVVVLTAGQVLHNNYIAWLLPLGALYIVAATAERCTVPQATG
jgi:hypothetical protein